MLDALDTHLKLSASPETYAAVAEANDLFEDYELQDYTLPYMDVLMTADNAEPSTITDEIVGLTIGFQVFILQQMDITLGDSLTVQQGNLLLRTMQQIETTEMVGEIYTLCDNADDNAETLCEIVALLSGEPVENLYGVITDVGDALITKIKELTAREDEDDAATIDLERNRVLVERLMAYLNFLETRDLAVYALILGGESVNLPYAHYRDAVMSLIPTDKPKVVAANLYAAALISSDAGENPRGIIMEGLNQYYTSVDVITPISVALEQTILNFNAQENSGVALKGPTQ